MGNTPSSTSKSGSPSDSGVSSTTSQNQRKDGHATNTTGGTKEKHWSDSHYIPPRTIQRSAAPPEASLAQAQGSTVHSRPKSLPPTAVSSLSASPHSQGSTPAKHTESSPLAIRDARQQQQQQPHQEIEASKPVDVPVEAASTRSQISTGLTSQIDSQLVSHNSLTDMYLPRPPRLPLPIEEEVHTPGSPILAPDESETIPTADLQESIEGLTRKSSGLSAGTGEDEDGELRVDRSRPVVPTKLEWLRGGDKVYVTGTIFQWNRKQRLLPVEGKPGCFASTVYILPGTHHLRFLVDGIMQTSPDLPTTVDFGNNLVNYIEVNPDDIPQQKPGHAGTKSATGSPKQARSTSPPKAPKEKTVAPKETHQREIPQYLVDFDQVEESPAYQNAVAAIEKLPTPPSLPGFLAKPILNAATLLKDDNSVLNMPNHTVLNHLATSSIKNNILAVSATTRYRNKYVTTIMYKPTSTTEG